MYGCDCCVLTANPFIVQQAVTGMELGHSWYVPGVMEIPTGGLRLGDYYLDW